MKITKEVYEAFDNFELEDISQMHRYERHIEHSEMLDEQVYTRAFNKPKSVEEQVENNIFNEQLKDAIHSLNNVQKRRIIKYFFEDKTLEEIADEEKCSKVAIKYSIDNALEKISKKFKN